MSNSPIINAILVGLIAEALVALAIIAAISANAGSISEFLRGML